ncbi:UNVERIFIED_CONTAM: protein RETICULATA-RELATED 5, chloroplastic [Sesamum angustifolium]|uniref:Protein RETICULATA-RELATED 5, chloroplastic n=1 Tax=Sesamum angustifolium TaxID=2727405 RepID=A0AAW2IJ70_9LAMI
MDLLTVKPPGFYLIPSSYGNCASCRRYLSLSVSCRRIPRYSGEECQPKRRDVLITPFLAAGAYAFRSAVAKADEKPALEGEARAPELPQQVAVSSTAEVEADPAVKEEVINSRIYDATVIGEPMALGKDKKKVWEKMMDAEIVYLGEAEQVPIRDDKELELEIVKILRRRCVEAERPMSLALEAFPCGLQEQLNQYMEKRIDADTLKSCVTHWPPERWQEYEPLLTYCQENGIRLVACGVPLEVLRTVQAGGVSGLSKVDRTKYAPPAGSGHLASGKGGESIGMLVVVTGASHVTYGSRGTGLPARIARKIQKKKQVVILLDPERQHIRREGEVPVADFLWYSAARPCSRNCFDRAEIARIMNAAGRKRDALPQDLQDGLDLGLVSPEVLQNFFDLEQYPIISELTHHFQVIAGIVEHRISEQFSDQTLLVNMISFVARTINSYWGTQQWIDLARYTGLQARKSKDVHFQAPDPPNSAALECNMIEDSKIDETTSNRL